MKLFSIVFNNFLVNTYLASSENKETILIDPAFSTSFEQEKIMQIIKNEELKIKYIIFTHTHVDHICGCEFIKNLYPKVPIMMHKDALLLYQKYNQYSSIMGFKEQQLPFVEFYIEDNQEIKIGNDVFSILHTPGHAPGSICIYNQKDNIVFTGDTLFHQSIGRTDLFGGSYKTLIDSIETKLLPLPPKTEVFPGHGDNTTIEFETNNNPFLHK